MEKQVRFDELQVGADFTCSYIGGAVYKKVSAKKAALPSGTVLETIFKGSAPVQITVPDPVPPTPEELAAQRAKRVETRLYNMSAYAQDAIDKFRANLVENALYAFEWSDDAIMAAARLDVTTRLKNILAHPEGGLDKTIDYARMEAMRGARYPSHSTSALTNFVRQCTTAAYAEFVEGF